VRFSQGCRRGLFFCREDAEKRKGFGRFVMSSEAELRARAEKLGVFDSPEDLKARAERLGVKFYEQKCATTSAAAAPPSAGHEARLLFDSMAQTLESQGGAVPARETVPRKGKTGFSAAPAQLDSDAVSINSLTKNMQRTAAYL
jgi:hypothetical protein